MEFINGFHQWVPWPSWPCSTSESSQFRAVLQRNQLCTWRHGPERTPRHRPGDNQRPPANLHWVAQGSPWCRFQSQRNGQRGIIFTWHEREWS
jgi:hypothetical protein